MKKLISLAICFLAICFSLVAQEGNKVKIELSKQGVLICNKDTFELQEGKTDIYSLLSEKWNINPFYADNELRFQFLDTCHLSYVFDLEVNEKLLQYPYCELAFECSDLSYKVFVNNVEEPKQQNNSLYFKQDIKHLLIRGENKIRIELEPVKPKLDTVKSENHNILVSEKRARFRHAAYQFGWDWAPRQLAGEVFTPLTITFSQQQNPIENINIQTAKLEKSNADMILSVMGLEDTELVTVADIEIYDQHNNIVERSKLESEYFYKNGAFSILKFEFSIKNPQLWYPHNMGSQPLYTAHIKLFDKKGALIHKEEKRFGVREIRLVREKDKDGESYYFTCNGKKLFAKGANLVPTKMHGEKYESLADHIDLVKDANMNMLRVWGGGFYMDERSLNACDENGILIWQDFPFACALYPSDEAYLQGVNHDALLNTSRIASHPCVALFCGNNEIFEGWENWGWKNEVRDTAEALKSYELLFKNILAEVVSVAAETFDYVHTSPIHGWGKPQSMTEGDSHYWGVWWGDSIFETYTRKVPRFMSEYGFQSPAIPQTVERYNSRPYSRENPEFAIHQKHNRGFDLIENRLNERFEIPTSDEDYLEKASLTACDAYKIAIEAHRRAKPYCMGSLLWQLNEPYPAISWSIIDADWQEKTVYHTVRKSFEPIILSIDTYKSEDSVFVYFINDTYKSQVLNWNIEIKTLDGSVKFQKSGSENATEEWGSHIIYSFSKKDIPSFNPQGDYIWVEAEVKDIEEGKKEVVQSTKYVCNYAFFVYPKHLEKPDSFKEVRELWLKQ